MKFKSDIEVQAGLKDSSGSIGTSGQVLSSTGSNVSWINQSTVASDVQNQVKAGVAINKGQAVYVTGADGTNIVVGLASNASEATSSKTLGLLDATVAINGFANVVQIGRLSGLNTLGAVAGDPVWLGTGGNLIYGLVGKPYAPANLVFIGIVTRVNVNNGEIFVNVQNGFELKEIHDVDIVTNVPINGDVLGYDGTLWVNKTIAGWLGYTPANASGTTNYISKFTGTTTLGNSQLYDNGTSVGIGTISPGTCLDVVDGSANSAVAQFSGAVQGRGFRISTFNSGTSDGGVLLNAQTTTNSVLAFATNSNERMRIDNLGNVGIGVSTMSQRLQVLGRMILDNGQESSYIGTNSGIADLATTLTRNVGIGTRTFQNNITGIRNVAVGVSASLSNLGNDNVAIGFETLRLNTVASNTGVGYQALTNATTAVENTAVGKFALREITTGGTNTAVGFGAGRFTNAGGNNTLGTVSLFLGHNTRALNNSDTNTIVIGAGALGIGSNSVVLGNNSIVTTALKGNVGIGNTSPTSRLVVDSDTNAADGIVSRNLNTGASAYTFVGAFNNTGGIDLRSYAPTNSTWPLTTWLNSSSGMTNGLIINQAGANPIQFWNNGAEKMRIASSGWVGIGTSSPSSKLQVDGAGYSFITGYDSGNRRVYIGLDSAGEPSIQGALSNGTARQISINPSGGNVGIGTTSPSSLLAVGGSGEPAAFSVSGISGINTIATFRDIDGENVFLTAGKISDSSIDIVFGDVNSAYGLPYYRINSDYHSFMDGNVGIGTDSPNAILDVAGDASINRVTIGQGPAVGQQNTALGKGALSSMVYGSANIAIGDSCNTDNDAAGLTTIGVELNTDTNLDPLNQDCLAISQYNSNTYSNQVPHIYAPKPIAISSGATNIITFDVNHYAGAIVEYMIRLDDGDDYALGTVYMGWKSSGTGNMIDVRQIEYSDMSGFVFSLGGSGQTLVLTNTSGNNAWIRITVRGMMTN